MKLDPTVMRTMNRQDYRVLAAVETGMKNHALVPSKLIASIANLRHGGTSKILSSLLRDKLLSHDCSCGYDGYRLTNSGYDILALHNLKSRGLISALGDRIGTGKESDVYVAANAEGKQVVLKFHRLGRTSFRDVKKKRDYFMVNAVSKNKKKGLVVKDQPNSWLFLSRISALKEYAFMKALFQVDYPTPRPVGHNRHVVVMGLVRGIPLYQVHTNRISAAQAESIFEQSTALATRLLQHGLVHCDLNEFNLMVDLSGIQDQIADDNDVGEHYVRHSGMSVVTRGALSAHGPLEKHHLDGTGEAVTETPPEPAAFLETGEPKPIVTLIDFPQMVSTRHPNAQELYERDLQCLKRFFVSKLKCVPEEGWEELMPAWNDIVVAVNHQEHDNVDAVSEERSVCVQAQIRLDEELQASGYSAQDANRDLELYYFEAATMQNGLSAVADDTDEDCVDELSQGDSNDSGNVDRVACENGKRSDMDELESLSDHEGDDIAVHNSSNHERAHIVIDGDDRSIFTDQSRALAEEKARARVHRHLEDLKKKKGRHHAFKSRNTNKTYVKGKRVLNDSLY